MSGGTVCDRSSCRSGLGSTTPSGRSGAGRRTTIRLSSPTIGPFLGVLKQHALRITRGDRIAYAVDAAFHQSNVAKIVELARGADQLFIEAAFLDEDAGIAAERRHLTARQAGAIARQAGIARLVPFHFSGRYAGREDALRQEAEAALRG